MISVLIPAYNEAERIGETLEQLRHSLADREHELIVIDDGSRDGTGEQARRHGAQVVTLTANQGKGQAMNHGWKTARGEILLLADADLGESAQAITGLLEPVLSGEADLAIARFPESRRKGGFGLVKGLARHGLYYYTGHRFYAPISGQRALRRQVIESIGVFRSGWGMEVAMTIDAHRSGFRIVEVPLGMTHRETGRDWAGFRHRGEQFRDIARELFRAYWRNANGTQRQ